MYVLIDLDENVAIDPELGVIGEMDEYNITANLAIMADRLDKLENIADDLFESLDPMTTPLITYPNREGIYRNLGRVSNFAYGFIFGMLIAALMALGLKGVM